MAVKLNMKKIKIPKFLKSVRYSLVAVNSLFVLTGLVLLITGLVILYRHHIYSQLITQRFFVLPGFTIGTGVVILVTSILGFYAAISEHFYFIIGYLGLLLVVLIFEIAITITGYELSSGTAQEIRSTMVQNLQLYSTRIEVAKLWDDMQMGTGAMINYFVTIPSSPFLHRTTRRTVEIHPYLDFNLLKDWNNLPALVFPPSYNVGVFNRRFQCCGVAGRHDYALRSIPVSCCYIDYGTISPFICSSEKAHSAGCASELGEWLSQNVYIIAAVALVVTVVQIVLTAITGWLAWRSKFEEVELEH